MADLHRAPVVGVVDVVVHAGQGHGLCGVPVRNAEIQRVVRDVGRHAGPHRPHVQNHLAGRLGFERHLVAGGAAGLGHGRHRLGEDETGAGVGHGHRHRRDRDPVVGAARCGGGVRYGRGLVVGVAVVGGAHGHRLRGRPVASDAVGERDGVLVPGCVGVGVDDHRRIVGGHSDRHVRRRVGCQRHRVGGLSRGAAQFGQREGRCADRDAVGLCPCAERADDQHEQQCRSGSQRRGGRAADHAVGGATAHRRTYDVGRRHCQPVPPPPARRPLLMRVARRSAAPPNPEGNRRMFGPFD